MPVEKYSGSSKDGRIEIEIRRHAEEGDAVQEVLTELFQHEGLSQSELIEMVQNVQQHVEQMSDEIANLVNLAFIFGLTIGPDAMKLATKRLKELQNELASGNWPEATDYDHPHAGWAGQD